MLRDDRSIIMQRLDHTDSEVHQYRKDVREMHDQLAKQLMDKVMDASRTSVKNMNFNN